MSLARALGVLLAMSAVGCGDDELPQILVVRDFGLTDQRGEPFSSDRLRGKVWVASFVFTSCRDVCPLITNHVANLHRRVPNADVRFVSVSVDPEVDTPERLSAYAERYRADARWVFLTGEPDAVEEVVTDVFHVPMGAPRSDEAGYDIAHSEQLFLVDAGGVLRGRYDTDRAGMDRLTRDIERLLGDR